MKTQTGIWIDSKRAQIVKIKNGSENSSEIESNIQNRIHHEGEGQKGSFMGTTHINNEKKFDAIKKQETDNYLKDVLNKVEDADELFIMGPGETKMKLKEYILQNNILAPKLKSVETTNSMTENQVVAHIKKYFEGQK